MTDEERLNELLRTALRSPTAQAPSRDLWPLIVERSRARPEWAWLDLGIAAVVAILLLLRPEWLRVLAFHL
jgi:hypothetical protein